MAVNKTVLIIDDDSDIVEVARLILEDEGYAVITDKTGDYFEHNEILPGLILLDLLIEGNSGEKIATQLKLSAKTQNVPIVIISAHTPTEVRTAMKKSGANDFITKPFDIDALVEVVNKHLPK